MEPDPWQRLVIESHSQQIMMVCSRQVGKTAVASAVVLLTAILEPPALVLVMSPSERQSAEFVRSVKGLYDALSRPKNSDGNIASYLDKRSAEAVKERDWYALPLKERETVLQLHLVNGSRVIGLPASEPTVRGYSGVSLLVIDEASRVPDDLYRAIRPMLAVSRGRLLALSTPFGKRGWFWEEWQEGQWERVTVPAMMCPRMAPEFLTDERRSLGERWYRQEYECSFEDPIDAVFDMEAVRRSLTEDVQPWTWS